MKLVLVILLFGIISVYCQVGLVQIKNGAIKGKSETSRGGRSFYSFYGIPYAAPPVEKLRLKPPVEPKSWSGILTCTEKPPICTQPTKIGRLNTPIIGQEDCLYINVFTHNISIDKAESKLPVLVYVHGGAFQTGEGAGYGPKYIMDQDLVYVTFNYRLGPLGFLSLGSDLVSGNYGLKDQNFALKWVKRNIAAFGGDPDNVALMGESAGAASVHFHFFSPLSEGESPPLKSLFHKAILNSGSAFTMWSHYDEMHAKALGNSFVFVTGCFSNDTLEVLDCLQRIPADVFTSKENMLYTVEANPVPLFRPTLETGLRDAFLPNPPSKKNYITKDIPIMAGINSGEGIFKAIGYIAGKAGNNIEALNNQHRNLYPLIHHYKFTAQSKDINDISDEIKLFYMGTENNETDADIKLVQMITDSMFSAPLIDMALSINGKRYIYLYDHRSAVFIQLFPHPKNFGACHADEIFLIGYKKEVDDGLTSTDVRVSERLVNYWSNFVIYGNPNGKSKIEVWKPVTSSAVEFLHIRTKFDEMEKNLWSDRIKFWKSLPLGNKFD